jgi:hypothetical protein
MALETIVQKIAGKNESFGTTEASFNRVAGSTATYNKSDPL